jgi:hypothetical protein
LVYKEMSEKPPRSRVGALGDQALRLALAAKLVF